jgi:hypothetical protein
MHDRQTRSPRSIYYRHNTVNCHLFCAFNPTFNEMHVPQINEDQSSLINWQRHLKLAPDESRFTARYIWRCAILKVADT